MIHTVVSIILCIFAINFVHITNCETVTCDERGTQLLDNTTRELFFFGEQKRLLPESERQREVFCKETYKSQQYVSDYSKKCLSAFPLQVSTVLMYGVMRKNKYYCTYKKGRKDIIQMSKCLNSIKSNGNRCMDQLIEDAVNILDAPVNIRMGLICCNYYEFEDCILNQAMDSHSSHCKDATITLIEQMLTGYTGDMLGLICSEYKRETDQCSKLLPLTPKFGHKQAKPKSILPPFIDLLSSIPV